MMATTSKDTLEQLFAQKFTAKEQARAQRDQSRNPRSYIMILGQTGSGKSTTIANLLNHIDGIPECTPYGQPGQASVTKEPLLYKGYLYDAPCSIIDQAGFGDTAGKTDASTLGQALVYVATQVPDQRIDGFLVVQSFESDRCHIGRNLELIETVFGSKALDRTMVLVTKPENLMVDPDDDDEINEAKTKLDAYKEEAARVKFFTPVFNRIADPKVGAKRKDRMLKYVGFKGQEHLYFPFLREQIQQHLFSHRMDQDEIPKKIKTMYDGLVYKFKEKKGAVAVQEDITGEAAPKVVDKKGYIEYYYDPSVGSVFGSIFSLGISAACGANQSSRWIPEKFHYQEKVKDVDFTFPYEGDAFGISVDVKGNGRVDILKTEGPKRKKFKLISTGPDPPTATLTLQLCEPSKYAYIDGCVRDFLEQSVTVTEEGIARFVPVEELSEQAESWLATQ